jgi:glutamine synthetase
LLVGPFEVAQLVFSRVNVQESRCSSTLLAAAPLGPSTKTPFNTTRRALGLGPNFSLGNATQGNPLDPGDTPHANAQFLVLCGAVIRAVSLHAKLLRAVVAGAGNDHRLGANEAPPAIISIFLGDQLTDVFEQIKGGGAKSSKAKSSLNIGVDVLPTLPKDAGDRNRTSPFAFTGNRFEFRAVGSSQSIGASILTLNVIVAESVDFLATELEKAGPEKLNETIQKLLKDIIDEHGSVIFNGNV